MLGSGGLWRGVCSRNLKSASGHFFRIHKQYLFLMWRIHLVISDGNTVAVEPVGSPSPEGDKKEIIVVQCTFSNGAVI
jgi:hypothetical protein